MSLTNPGIISCQKEMLFKQKGIHYSCSGAKGANICVADYSSFPSPDSSHQIKHWGRQVENQ